MRVKGGTQVGMGLFKKRDWTCRIHEKDSWPCLKVEEWEGYAEGYGEWDR